MKQDTLVKISMDKWTELQEVLKQDFPRSMLGYAVLETQLKWEKEGHGFGFTVYCPSGNPEYGMVGVNAKDYVYELIIQCPSTDTSKLEDALKATDLIDWTRPGLKMAATPPHITEMAKRLAEHFKMKMSTAETDRFVYDESRPLLDVSVPPELTFKLITSLEYAELMDSNWPHRFPDSVKYSEFLIKARSSYGLFSKDKLLSWMSISEHGFLLNLFTLEQYRKKGYAELVTKSVCNELKSDNRLVFGFVVKGNNPSYQLFDQKLLFEKTGKATWCFFEK